MLPLPRVHVAQITMSPTNLMSHEEDCATESSCWARNANPRLPVKMIECRKKSWIRSLLRWLRGRKKGREFARYQIGYYMGLQQKHTQQLALGFTTRGKSREGGERGFGFYGLKGSSALIMPHLKLPCHTLAQFRLAGSFSFSTNQPHPCMQTPKRR